MLAKLRAYYQLCKPNVVYTMLITALVGSLLAANSFSCYGLIVLSQIGIGLCAASAAAINQIIDQKADANMQRTLNRPLPTQTVTNTEAIVFAATLGIVGFGILYIFVNPITAYLTFASLIGYAFIYTIFLKRATPQNIVIGGLAGAAPPLLGWTAITGSIDAFPLLLVLIIFVWTPPHFWALAIYRKDDYAGEGIPMLPVTHGIKFTKLQILLYSILLLIVSILPYVVMLSGLIYLMFALLTGLIFVVLSFRFYIAKNESLAMPIFSYSIYYIFIIFIGFLLDKYFYI
ncbi:MAG: heme o synthase [Gammaproteobacteria bacterium]